MKKILLCGNGINIQRDKSFNLSQFIDLIMDEQKLRSFYYEISNGFYRSITSDQEIEDFIFIIDKYKNEIKKAANQLSSNGVEAVFLELFKLIEEYMKWETDEKIYQEFEITFKKIFFNYILKLQIKQKNYFIYNNPTAGFESYIHTNNYEKIVTLNYDTLLEENEKIDGRNILHWHGKIKIKSDQTIDFSNCLLDTIRNPKSSQSLPQLGLFKNYINHKQVYELDIIGLNPMNDENIFALFINSQICKTINFYYHSNKDISNLEQILEKIKNMALTLSNNKIGLKKISNSKFIIERKDQKYILKFIDDFNGHVTNDILEINLYPSSIFWNNCKNSEGNSGYFNIFNV